MATQMPLGAVPLAALLTLAACGPPMPPGPPPPAPAPEIGPGAAPPASTGDAPEISRSVGAEGGVVVLWPRIVRPRKDQGPLDAETRQLAAALQRRAQEVAAKAAPGASIDVRPEPERVCPRAGCKAMTVGLLFTRTESACAVAALIAPSGASPAKIVPWGGRIKVHQETVAFREPPEKQIGVEDYVPCAKLLEELSAKDGDVAAAIRAAR